MRKLICIVVCALAAVVASAQNSPLAFESPLSGSSPEPLSGWVELSPTRQMISVVLNAGTVNAKRFLVQDGAMNSLTVSSGARLVFIAKHDQVTGAVRFHKVDQVEVQHDGKTKKMLRVGKPLTQESTIDELQKVGVNTIELSLGENRVVLSVGADRAKYVCPEEPCSGDKPKCCSYTPCPPDTWGRFCTWGSEGGCGGDGCGECCV